MERIVIDIPASENYRATEIVADLREAAETLFFPMKTVGYWDLPTGDHLCPQAMLRAACPHALPQDDAKRLDYLTTVERDLDAVLEVFFPHAQVRLFLS